MYNEGIRAYTAGEALAAHRRVKIEGGTTTTPPEVVYADAGEQHIGVTEYAVDDGDLASIRLRTYPGTVEVEAADTFAVNATLYGAADGKISDSSSGSAIGIAHEACTGAGDIVEVVPFNVLSTTAGTVSIADAGAFTSEATVEAALQEIYQSLLTAKGIITIPMPTITNAGVALAAFSGGDSALPGFCVTAEGLGIRWNNHGTPTPVGTKVIIPPDMDITANATLHILAAKVGATIGDAVTFTIEAFNNVVDALYDADADFGGATDAMTGDAATKTVQHVTRTLALANLTAYPAAMELTIQPTDGTLGTDDVILLAHWIEYQRKLLAA